MPTIQELATPVSTRAFLVTFSSAGQFSNGPRSRPEKNGAKESVALCQPSAALHEAEFGNVVEASRQAEAALSLAPGRDVRVLATMALARAGNTTEVTKPPDSLNQEFPLDTVMERNVLPTIRGMLALRRGDSERCWR